MKYQVEFIKNEDNKYVRLLGAFYLRLVGKPLEVYEYLEARPRFSSELHPNRDHGGSAQRPAERSPKLHPEAALRND